MNKKGLIPRRFCLDYTAASHGMRSVPWALLLLTPLLLAVWGPLDVRGEEDLDVREAYGRARVAAENDGNLKSSIEYYRAVMEAHQANEKLYREAVRELAKCYEKSEQPEEAMRVLVSHAETMAVLGSREDVLRQTLHPLMMKYPELWKKLTSSPPAKRPPLPNSFSRSELLSREVLQRKDPELRSAALAKIAEMLGPDSSEKSQREGLAALRLSLRAKFDRQPFRPLVIPLLQADHDVIRSFALTCLPQLDATADDLALVLPMIDDEYVEARKALGGVLIAIAKGEEPDRVIPAITSLLRDEDSKVIVGTLRSMWGQYTSPAFDALLIELSNDSDYHGYVIYHCLSTMRTKSKPVCQRLVEELADPDWNNSGRAAWGLTYGVTDEAKEIVEEGLLKALAEELNDYTRRQELRALQRVATEKSRAYLQSVANSDQETDEFRKQAKSILAQL